MQHLNLCRQLVKQLSNKQKIPNTSTQERQNISHVLDLVSASTKFILPDGGHLFGDYEFKALDETEDLRLPYPMVALEYFVPKDENSQLREDQSYCSKRIIFAREREGHIVLTLAFFYHAEGSWLVYPDCAIETKNYLDRSVVVNGQVKLLIKSSDQRVPLGDFAEEVSAMLSFLNALQCANIKVEKSPAKNAAKAMRKALPFDDYHLLTIETKATKLGVVGSGSGHRSPREHLRRGHIRRYENGMKIWVNAALVNPGVGGKVTKDYRLVA